MENPIVESTPIWPFVWALIIFAVALAWFAWQYWMLRKKTCHQDEEKPADVGIKSLKEKLKEYEKIFNKLNPVVERYVSLRDGIQGVVAIPRALDKLIALQELMVQAKLWDKKLTKEEGEKQLDHIFLDAKEFASAEETILCIHKKIDQFYGQLRIVDLDEATERKIRSDFLELAMLMMDVLESIKNPNYIEDHQGVNVRLLKEKISLDEAIAMTSPVTYLNIETSSWAQKLFKSIEKWAGSSLHPQIEQRPYMLNGLRFEFNHQN